MSATDHKKEQRKVLRNFSYYTIGIFFCYSAFAAVFNLQSSINVEDGLGTITIGISFAISLVSVIYSPILIRKFGVKVCILLGDVAPIPFFLANLYPFYYTILPAGIIMTCLQSPMWPSMSIINVEFATQFSVLKDCSRKIHILSFSGYFYLMFQTSQIFGNLLCYVILYGFDQVPIYGSESFENCTDIENTTCEVPIADYGYCGVNDCQNETIISEQIAQYKPVNRISLYVLIGVMVFLELLALLIHAILLPGRKESFRNPPPVIASGSDNAESDQFEMENVNEITGEENVTTNLNKPVTKPDDGIINTSLVVLKHLVKFKFLLLVPITLYNGLTLSFVFTELTRAFASCSLGVQWVGLCMAVFGISDAFLSWVVGKFGRKIGRITCFIIGLVIEIGNYLQCIFWSADSNRLLSVLALFLCFGFTDGIFQTIINVTHIDFFEKNMDVAMSAWSLIVDTGIGLGFLLSKALCVRTRVYLNFSLLVVGCIGVIVAQRVHKKTQKTVVKSNEEEINMEPY